MTLAPITYAANDHNRLHIRIFDPWSLFIPLFMAGATAIAALRSFGDGLVAFGVFLLLILAVLIGGMIAFLSVRQIAFDRQDGSIRVQDRWLHKSTQRDLRLDSVEHLIFTYKQNLDSVGRGTDMPQDADISGRCLFYIGLSLTDGEEVRLHARKGPQAKALGQTLRDWLAARS